jgi:hypothetical protein
VQGISKLHDGLSSQPATDKKDTSRKERKSTGSIGHRELILPSTSGAAPPEETKLLSYNDDASTDTEDDNDSEQVHVNKDIVISPSASFDTAQEDFPSLSQSERLFLPSSASVFENKPIGVDVSILPQGPANDGFLPKASLDGVKKQSEIVQERDMHTLKCNEKKGKVQEECITKSVSNSSDRVESEKKPIGMGQQIMI